MHKGDISKVYSVHHDTTICYLDMERIVGDVEVIILHGSHRFSVDAFFTLFSIFGKSQIIYFHLSLAVNEAASNKNVILFYSNINTRQQNDFSDEFIII